MGTDQVWLEENLALNLPNEVKSSKSMVNRALICWHCGESIEKVPLPISRFAVCPTCQSDLHVCRLCRFYTHQFIGECSHDRADRVLDKEKTNFCTHFRPTARAYHPQAEETSTRHVALTALFGDEVTSTKTAANKVAEEREQAQSQLDELFGLPPCKDVTKDP